MDPFAKGNPNKVLESEYMLPDNATVDLSLVDEDPEFGPVPALHNQKAKDRHARLKEKPEHRIMLHLKLSGKTNKEISEITGLGYHSVCTICRQDWFLKRFAYFSAQYGKDAVDSIFESEAMNSIQTLIEIRDNGKNESNRRAAAEHILDRFLGKPAQHIHNTKKHIIEPGEGKKKLQTLDQQIEELEKEISERDN